MSPHLSPCYTHEWVLARDNKKTPPVVSDRECRWGAVLDSFVVLFPGQGVGRVVAVVVVAELLAHCSFGHNFAR